jgi:hypothetical protein
MERTPAWSLGDAVHQQRRALGRSRFCAKDKFLGTLIHHARASDQEGRVSATPSQRSIAVTVIESAEGICLVSSPSLASASGPTEPPANLATVRMTAEAGDTDREQVAAPTAGFDVDLD